MFNKGQNASSYGAGKGRRSTRGPINSMLVVKNNNLDEGIIAFGLWLKDEESRDSLAISFTMKEFHQDNAILLRDNILQEEVTVRIVEGVPFCNECRLDDCMHVGFAICAEQMKWRSRSEWELALWECFFGNVRNADGPSLRRIALKSVELTAD